MSTFKSIIKEVKPNASELSALTGQVLHITPELAEEWLANNIANRPLNNSNVRFLINQLQQNKWMLNGEAIKIAPDGELLDGQHRLEAIRRSGIAATSVVIFNCPKESKHTMDTGKNRSAADVLSFNHNTKYVGALAATVKFILLWESKKYGLAGDFKPTNYGGKGGISSGINNKSSVPDNTDVLNFVEKHPEVISFVEEGMRLRANGDKLLPPKIFVGMKWILDKYGKRESDQFFTIFSTGAGIEQGHPIHTLRKLLIEINTNRQVRVRKLTGTDLLKVIVRTWNALYDGEKLIHLRVPEEMPEIKKYK